MMAGHSGSACVCVLTPQQPHCMPWHYSSPAFPSVECQFYHPEACTGLGHSLFTQRDILNDVIDSGGLALVALVAVPELSVWKKHRGTLAQLPLS